MVSAGPVTDQCCQPAGLEKCTLRYLRLTLYATTSSGGPETCEDSQQGC